MNRGRGEHAAQDRDAHTTGEWRLVRLGDIAEIYDGPHATPRKTDSGPVFLGISSLCRGQIDLSEVEHLSEDDFVTWTRRITPRHGDVVFSYETRLGEAAAIPTGLRCCLGRRMGLLRAKPARVDSRFLLYAYLGPQFQETIRARTVRGSTVDRISLNEMPDFPVLVPSSLRDQRAIVSVLGALDDKIELLRRMNRVLEEMSRAIFRSWFDSLKPSDVAIVSVQDLVDSTMIHVSDGYRARGSEMAASGLPFARAGNLNNGFRFDDGADLLGDEGVRMAAEKVSRPWDVVFTSKGTVGRCAVVHPNTNRFVYSPQLCFWRSLDHERLNPLFLLYWMQSPLFLHQVAAVAGQTDMALYVNLRDQRRMRMHLPEPEAQRRLDKRLRPLVERIELNERHAVMLAATRDTLLPRLLTGELRVPDAAHFVTKDVRA